MKRAVFYLRVSTVDQHPESQLYDLRQLVAQHGYEIVHEYTDRISGVKAKRPSLDRMMADARRSRFDVDFDKLRQRRAALVRLLRERLRSGEVIAIEIM